MRNWEKISLENSSYTDIIGRQKADNIIFDWICKKESSTYTCDLQTSTIHNFRRVKAMNLQIIQFRVLTWCKKWWKFQTCINLNANVWSFKVKKLNACGRPLFANPVTYLRLIYLHNTLIL